MGVDGGRDKSRPDPFKSRLVRRRPRDARQLFSGPIPTSPQAGLVVGHATKDRPLSTIETRFHGVGDGLLKRTDSVAR